MLMNLPKDHRPTLDLAWENFMKWLNDIRKSPNKPVIFCAYNGYQFDFFLLVLHLEPYGLKFDKSSLFIDPYIDLFRLDRTNASLDFMFK